MIDTWESDVIAMTSPRVSRNYTWKMLKLLRLRSNNNTTQSTVKENISSRLKIPQFKPFWYARAKSNLKIWLINFLENAGKEKCREKCTCHLWIHNRGGSDNLPRWTMKDSMGYPLIYLLLIVQSADKTVIKFCTDLIAVVITWPQTLCLCCWMLNNRKNGSWLS